VITLNEQVKKVLKYLIVPLIVSLVLEIFVFNFNHFISLFYPRETKIDFNIYPKGMNYFRESDTTYYFYVIEMLDINAKINNFYLNVHDDATINLYLTDEANKNLYDANVHNLVSTIEKSNYIKLNTSGKTTLAKFEIQTESENLKIDEIIINKTIPIFFNFMRFLICAVIMVAFLCFKNFKLFLGKYDEYKYKYVLIGAFIFVFLGLYLFINFSSRGNLDSNSAPR